MAELTAKPRRILKTLHHAGGGLARDDVGPGSLERLGYVERRHMAASFEYRITELGKRALAEYDREHGEVLLR